MLARDDNQLCRHCGLDTSISDLPAVSFYNRSLDFYQEEVTNGRQMESLLGKQSGFLAPVHRIPDEILLLILRMSCDVYVYPVEGCFEKGTQL